MSETEAPSVEAQACRLFPNQGMHGNAAFLASLHPQAIDYLTQAPVLAACFGVKHHTRADRLYIASRIGGPISRGERLRSVMASVGVATPLRKLTGYAITPMMSEFVRDLADLDSSTLSQSIPDKPKAQRRWLSDLREWRRRMRLRGRPTKLGFAWIARQAHRCEEGQAGDLADFLANNPTVDFPRWSLERMQNEVELWHDRLAADTSVSRYGLTIKPSTVIDLSDWPDHSEAGGFEFFKLSTPAMIIEEGQRQRHCVAAYIPLVMDGSCHLFSIRANMRRMATLQVSNGRVVQLKGFANRTPPKAVSDASQCFVSDHARKLAA